MHTDVGYLFVINYTDQNFLRCRLSSQKRGFIKIERMFRIFSICINRVLNKMNRKTADCVTAGDNYSVAICKCRIQSTIIHTMPSIYAVI